MTEHQESPRLPQGQHDMSVMDAVASSLGKDRFLSGVGWAQAAYVFYWKSVSNQVAEHFGFWWAAPDEPAQQWRTSDPEAYWMMRRWRTAQEADDRVDTVVLYLDAPGVRLASPLLRGASAGLFRVPAHEMGELGESLRVHLDALDIRRSDRRTG